MIPPRAQVTIDPDAVGDEAVDALVVGFAEMLAELVHSGYTTSSKEIDDASSDLRPVLDS